MPIATPTIPNKNDSRAPNAQWWMIACGVTVVLILLVVSVFVPYMTERVKFFTANALSAFVLTAIIVQAYIYTKQWKAMQSQLDITKRQQESVEQQLILLGIQADAVLNQWSAMRDQTDSMRDSLVETRTLVAQNERAVNASEANVETVEKTAIYANRAYVVAKIRGVGEGAGALQFRLRIENSGNTPANDVCVSYAYGLLEGTPHNETPDKLVVYDAGFTEIERLGLVAPNSSYHVISTPKITLQSSAEHEGWRLEQLKFYCWGRIVYEDIFNWKRHTDFCFVQSRTHPSGYPCEHGNQAI